MDSNLPLIFITWFRYTLNDALDMMMDPDIDLFSNIDSDAEETTLVMIPPLERASTQSDQDSDASDDLNKGHAYHLPKRLLNSACSLNIVENKSRAFTQSEKGGACKKKCKTSKRAARKWKKQFLFTNANVKLSGSISIPQLTRDTVKSPLDCFYSMFSPDLLTYITSQTNLYASQHGQTLNADESEIRTVIAIILLSGYCKVPYRELYWTVSPDTHNVAVANAMSRNRFRDILYFQIYIWLTMLK